MIIKEPIAVRGSANIAVSSEARVLAAGITDDTPVVWIDEPRMNERTETVEIVSVFTGDDAPDMRHLGTIQNRGIVVHVFWPFRQYQKAQP